MRLLRATNFRFLKRRDVSASRSFQPALPAECESRCGVLYVPVAGCIHMGDTFTLCCILPPPRHTVAAASGARWPHANSKRCLRRNMGCAASADATCCDPQTKPRSVAESDAHTARAAYVDELPAHADDEPGAPPSLTDDIEDWREPSADGEPAEEPSEFALSVRRAAKTAVAWVKHDINRDADQFAHEAWCDNWPLMLDFQRGRRRWVVVREWQRGVLAAVPREAAEGRCAVEALDASSEFGVASALGAASSASGALTRRSVETFTVLPHVVSPAASDDGQ